MRAPFRGDARKVERLVPNALGSEQLRRMSGYIRGEGAAAPFVTVDYFK